MSLRPLASLAVKLLGLYAILNALPGISSVLATLAASRSFAAAAGAGGPSPIALAFANLSGVVLLLTLGLAFWWFSDNIARSVVREEVDVPAQRNDGLMGIGFSVVGAYLLVDFAVELTRFLGRAYMVSQTNSLFRPEESHVGIVDFLPILIRGVLALYLLLGARGLVQGLAGFRNVGRDRELESEVQEAP